MRILLILPFFFAFTFGVFGQQGSILIPKNSIWKYDDSGFFPGATWKDPSFNDATWASGPGKLGYNESDLSTVISYGGNASNKHISYYFRKTFNATNVVGMTHGLILRYLRDDAVIVYINGVEVLRSNLPIGPITHTTRAGRTASGAEEDLYFEAPIPSTLLNEGSNTIAVELHQKSPSSSDLIFDLELLSGLSIWTSRNPYLQNVSPTAITIKWQTSIPTETRLTYGDSPGNQPNEVSDPVLKWDHEVTLSGLTSSTTYYYAVKSGTQILAGGNFDHYFTTSPDSSPSTPIEFWLIGDAGTGRDAPRNTFQAYKNYMGVNRPELFLLLGDNAYDVGSERDYQEAFFDVFPDYLANIPVYSCPGNHDYYTNEETPDIANDPYFQIFSLPQAGEGGGYPSGSETYYSFDYGDIHIISLTTEGYDLDPSGPQGIWLANDLATNNSKWTIVLLHSPPYTKGSFNSDQSSSSTDVRQHILPMLEANGVDMIFSADSHVFERSKFINGHYGLSGSFNPATMIVQSGDGKEDGDCSYIKSTTGPNANKGTIYCVLGSTGRPESGPFDHPAMQYGIGEAGSMSLSILNNRIDFSFLDDQGNILDYFTLHKDVGVNETINLDPGQSTTLTASWEGTYTWSPGGATTRSITVSPAVATTYTVTDANGCVTDTYQVQPSGTPTTISLSAQVEFPDDDAEQSTGSGYTSLSSSDLELAMDGSRNQVVGLRFRNLNIPQGVTISSAYIQFTADETDSGPISLTIEGEAHDNAPPFVSAFNNLSNRTVTQASVSWSPNDWTTVGDNGPDQQTVDISSIIEEIVGRPGWTPGNSVVILIRGTGERTAESANGSGADMAPIIYIDYLSSIGTPNIPPTANLSALPASGPAPLNVSFDGTQSIDPDGIIVDYAWDFGDGNTGNGASLNYVYSSVGVYNVTLTVTDDNGAIDQAFISIDAFDNSNQIQVSSRVMAASDDAEEGIGSGAVSITSSDLELGNEGTREQIVGIRFPGLNIPTGANISEAYIQFTVDETDNGSALLTIRGEATDNAQPYQSISYSLSTRNETSQSVLWSPPDWQFVGAAGVAQQTPNLASLVQEIVDRPGWNANNAIAFLIEGLGQRTAESHKSSRLVGPELFVSYDGASSARVAGPQEFIEKVVYPNPFKDVFFVRVMDEEIDWIDIRILDLNGRMVYQQQEIPTDYPIQLGADLANGMYILQITGENRFEDLKIVKLK